MYTLYKEGELLAVSNDLMEINNFIQALGDNPYDYDIEEEPKELDYDTERDKMLYLMAKIELMMENGSRIKDLEEAKQELLIVKNNVSRLKPEKKGKIK